MERQKCTELFVGGGGSGKRSLYNQRGCLPLLLTVAVLLALQFNIVGGLWDDWYGFTSFDDASEFKSVYRDTCSYTYDIFREPRLTGQRNDLRPRRELLTPIRFSSKDTIKSSEKHTLHIYNYAAIRRAYSVSYGFQRNKECLHGQDVNCVVYPEIGRVRALVVNADRFSAEEHNLNFIKDHFLIEEPERFVSILNGGSPLEREFYEAVFVGGYSDDPARTSHQIDGKKYPLEIYMYFLDETVPSVSLATILVVLVEESSRDNPLIEPIVNAVESKLYDKERRFIESQEALFRGQRVFHHLMGSTSYDVHEEMHADKEDGEIIDRNIASSVEIESTYSKLMEAFERMQAVEAKLYLLEEDLHLLKEAKDRGEKEIEQGFGKSKSNEIVPSKLIEYKMLIHAALYSIEKARCEHDYEDIGTLTCSINFDAKTCNNYSTVIIKDGAEGEPLYFTIVLFLGDLDRKSSKTNPVPKKNSNHQKALIDLAAKVCTHFEEKYFRLLKNNTFGTEATLQSLTTKEKYKLIRDFIKERLDRNEMNKLIYQHVHGTSPKWHDWAKVTYTPDYKDEQQKYHIADGIFNLAQRIIKSDKYRKLLKIQEEHVKKIATDQKFENKDDMRKLFRYLKYGTEQKDLKDRSQVRQEFLKSKQPGQRKKQGFVELGGMGISKEDMRRSERLSPIKATVEEAFQISWLIPEDGGYYYYSGSSPLPPCFRAQNVIVFKRPIKMSKRQIETLTRIPTSFDRDEDIRFTTPFVHDTEFEVELSGPDTKHSRIEEVKVPVYNQPRNHLFLGHDGFRKNAVVEWNKIKAERKKRSSSLANVKQDKILLMMAMVYAVNLF